MTTSAGRFNSTISNGSHRRSMVLLRPIATPSTVPKAIASAKATATRASVTARFKNKAPDQASVAMTDRTASGDGSVPVEDTREPTCQTSSNRISGSSRSKKALVFPGRQTDTAFIVSLLIKFLCRAGEVRAAGLGEDLVENPRVGGFLFDRPPRDAIDIDLPVKGELCFVANFDLPGDVLPIRVGMSKNVLGFGCDLEEPRQGIGMAARKTFVEDIADHGNRSLGAEASFHFVHADEPPEPARFERNAEIPKV